jgi:hypothetical protein
VSHHRIANDERKRARAEKRRIEENDAAKKLADAEKAKQQNQKTTTSYKPTNKS